MEINFTIPVNEAFDNSIQNPSCGCPLCNLYKKLEEDELDLILGASMMEPDIRIKTNEQGFCRLHYDMMFVRKNRLGMALTLETHLDKIYNDIAKDGLFSSAGQKVIEKVNFLNDNCYVCNRINTNFEHMEDTAVYLWEKDEDFQKKLTSQPYFCLPHYAELLKIAQKRLNKKLYSEFEKQIKGVVLSYFDTLKNDVSWFCKKFDYRYDAEPWYNSKDAVERAFKFLRSDIHNK